MPASLWEILMESLLLYPRETYKWTEFMFFIKCTRHSGKGEYSFLLIQREIKIFKKKICFHSSLIICYYKLVKQHFQKCRLLYTTCWLFYSICKCTHWQLWSDWLLKVITLREGALTFSSFSFLTFTYYSLSWFTLESFELNIFE